MRKVKITADESEYIRKKAKKREQRVKEIGKDDIIFHAVDNKVEFAVILQKEYASDTGPRWIDNLLDLIDSTNLTYKMSWYKES